MSPLMPSDVDKARSLGATDDDIRKYNQLVAQRFATNPFLPKSPEQKKDDKAREQEIGDLYHKLFSDVRMHNNGE